MRASVYNNPLFAEGLASLIENYIGNPEREMEREMGMLNLENQRLQNQKLQYDLANPRRSGGGGGGGGSAPKTDDPVELSTSTRTTLRTLFKDNPDLYGQAIGIVTGGLGDQLFGSEDEALAYILQNMVEEEVVTDPNTWSSGSWIGERIANVFQSPETETRSYIRPLEPPASTPAPTSPTTTSGGVAQPKNKAEYDALPSGTRYLAPDGTVRTKP